MLIINLQKKKSSTGILMGYIDNFRKKCRMIKLHRPLIKSTFLHTKFPLQKEALFFFVVAISYTKYVR